MNLRLTRRQTRLVVLVGAVLGLFYLIVLRPPEAPPTSPDPSPSATPVAGATPSSELRNALFARLAIPRGTRFDSPGKIGRYMVLKEGLQSGFIPNETAHSYPEMKGQIAIESLAAGEPIVLSRFLSINRDGTVSSHVAEGRRALTIRTDTVHGVAGFVRQGDRVDVVGSFTGEGGKSVTRIVLQDVKVLALNAGFRVPTSELDVTSEVTPTAADTPPGRTVGQGLDFVTFEVTPGQAETLTMASDLGRIYLVLRGESDRQIQKVEPVDLTDVMGGRATRPPDRKYDVDVLKAANRKPTGIRVESTELQLLSTGVRNLIYQELVP
jgi:Flp pilus assembly protein CpaB